ncbi:hypothetical protein Ancab_008396 [Ancistrocladus abbreviatus]
MGLFTSILLLAAFVTLLLLAEAGGVPLAKPKCLEKCGDLTIPYPFGIGEGCFDESDSSFNLTCNETTGVTTLGQNLEVLNITLDGQIRILHWVAYDCYDQSGKRTAHNAPWLSLVNFTISSSHNKLVAIGCDDYVYLQGFRNGTAYWVGCTALCLSVEDLVNDTCNGIGCCETSIPEGVSNITTEVFSYYNHTYVGNFNPCSSAAVVASDAFVFSIANISTTAEEYRSLPQVPVVLNWTIGSKSCYAAETHKTVLCNENSNCTDPPGEVGYRCQCWTGYEGNPYIAPGCQDIDECSVSELNDCKKPATCKNNNGGYKCKCPLGLRGAGTNSDPCLPTTWLIVIAAAAGLIVVMGGGFRKIVNEQTTKQLKEVAHVARACLNMKGEERPTMREVEHELEGIKGIGKPHPWSYYDPNALQNQEEREHLLQIALKENGGYSISDATNMHQSLNVERLPLDGR